MNEGFIYFENFSIIGWKKATYYVKKRTLKLPKRVNHAIMLKDETILFVSNENKFMLVILKMKLF